MKKLNKIKGRIFQVGKTIKIEREGKSDILKKTINVITEDKQVLYPQIADDYLHKMLKDRIGKGDLVEIGYIFAGSYKNGKRYNNIHIINIQKV